MEKLNEIFYNSKSRYMSKKRFVEADKLLEINNKDAEEFYDKQAVNQTKKNKIKKKNLPE